MSKVRVFIYNKSKNGKASIKINWIIFNIMFNLLIKLYSNSNSFLFILYILKIIIILLIDP